MKALTIGEIKECYFNHDFPERLWGEIEKIPVVVEENGKVNDAGVVTDVRSNWINLNEYKRKGGYGRDGQVRLEMMLERALSTIQLFDKEIPPETVYDIDFMEKLLPIYVKGVVSGSSYVWNSKRQTVYIPGKTKLHRLEISQERDRLIYKHIKTVEGNDEEVMAFLRQNLQTDKKFYNSLSEQGIGVGDSLDSLYIISHRGNSLSELHRHIRMSTCG